MRFAQSRIRVHNWICSQCANGARDARVECYLARKYAAYLRRRGFKAPYPGVAFVRTVLAAQQQGGNENARKMSLKLKESSEGAWDPANVVLVGCRGQ